MDRDILHYQNRIELMQGRSGRDNGKIIAKLKRKIAKLKEKETN